MVIFAHMEQIHEGKKLEEIIKANTSIEKLAEKIHKHRNTIRGWFALSEVSLDNLILVGKGLRLDLTQYFPRLKKYDLANELQYFNEDPGKYLSPIQEVKDIMASKEQVIADSKLEIKLLQEKIEDLKTMIEQKNELLDSKQRIIEFLESQIEMAKSRDKTG